MIEMITQSWSGGAYVHMKLGSIIPKTGKQRGRNLASEQGTVCVHFLARCPEASSVTCGWWGQ